MLEADDGLLTDRLQRLASLIGEPVMTKTQYGDTIVRMRRTARMGLAAGDAVVPAATHHLRQRDRHGRGWAGTCLRGRRRLLDYAVDADVARFAVFDGMGHGLASAQLTTLAVAVPQRTTVRPEPDRDGGAHRDRGLPDLPGRGVRHRPARRVAHGDRPLRVGQRRSSRTARPPRGSRRQDPRGAADAAVRPRPQLRRTRHGGDGGLRAPAARRPAAAVHRRRHRGALAEGDFFGLDRLVDLVVRNLAAGLPAPETMRRAIRPCSSTSPGTSATTPPSSSSSGTATPRALLRS